MKTLIHKLYNAPVWSRPFIGIAAAVIIIATSPLWLIVAVGFLCYDVIFMELPSSGYVSPTINTPPPPVREP